MLKQAATTAIVVLSAMAAHAVTTADAAQKLFKGHSMIFDGVNNSGEPCTASIRIVNDSIIADVDEVAVVSNADATAKFESAPQILMSNLSLVGQGHRERIFVDMLFNHVSSVSVSRPGTLYGSNLTVCSQLQPAAMKHHSAVRDIQAPAQEKHSDRVVVSKGANYEVVAGFRPVSGSLK